jgi:hypothetical protein
VLKQQFGLCTCQAFNLLSWSNYLYFLSGSIQDCHSWKGIFCICLQGGSWGPIP